MFTGEEVFICKFPSWWKVYSANVFCSTSLACETSKYPKLYCDNFAETLWTKSVIIPHLVPKIATSLGAKLSLYFLTKFVCLVCFYPF